MINFNEFNKINEGFTSIIYHFTYVSNLNKIIKNDQLNLSGSMGSNVENSDKNYFASFSRTKSIKHGYGSKFNFDGSVRIKIDGDKLKHNYKGIQFDYWRMDRDVRSMRKSPSMDEAEDRLISDKPSIPNFSNYIIKVDILKPEKGKQIHKSLLDDAEKLGIKLYFFRTEEDFAYGLESKSVSLNEYEINENEEEEYNRYYSFFKYYSSSYKVIALYLFNDKDSTKEDKLYSELSEMGLSEEDISDLKIKVDDSMINLKYDLVDYKLNETSSELLYHLNNLNKGSNSKFNRYLYHLVAKEYRKYNSESFKEYLITKIEGTTKRQKDYNKEIINYLNSKIDDIFKKGLDYYKDDMYESDQGWVKAIEDKEYKDYIDMIIEETKRYLGGVINNDTEKYKNIDYKIDDLIYNLKTNLDIITKEKKILSRLGDDFSDYTSIGYSFISNLLTEVKNLTIDKINDYRKS